MGKQSATWVFILAGGDVLGWVFLVGITNFEWIYTSNYLWIIRSTLFTTRMKKGGIPGMLTHLVNILGGLGVPATGKITGVLESFFTETQSLQNAAQMFCTPTFQATLSSWCYQWHYAWIGGMLMATCIGFACLLMIVGCVILHFYIRQPTSRGWNATLWCFSVAPATLLGGFLAYALLTQSFGNDEFSTFPGLSPPGASGPQATWGVGFIFGQCLTLLSGCPVLMVACGMERSSDDDADIEQFINKESSTRSDRKQPHYGAHASSTASIGSALTGTAGYGMMHPGDGLQAVQIVQEEYVTTQGIPGQYVETQAVQLQPMPMTQPPLQPSF